MGEGRERMLTRQKAKSSQSSPYTDGWSLSSAEIVDGFLQVNACISQHHTLQEEEGGAHISRCHDDHNT